MLQLIVSTIPTVPLVAGVVATVLKVCVAVGFAVGFQTEELCVLLEELLLC